MYTRDRTFGHPIKIYRHLTVITPRIMCVKICIQMLTTIIKQCFIMFVNTVCEENDTGF